MHFIWKCNLLKKKKKKYFQLNGSFCLNFSAAWRSSIKINRVETSTAISVITIKKKRQRKKKSGMGDVVLNATPVARSIVDIRHFFGR